MAAFWLALCLLPAASALLTRATHSNAVFGLPATEELVPTLSLPALPASAPFSALFTGTLTPTTTETLLFSATTDGVIRLYINDHLVLDDSAAGCSRSLSSWLPLPVLASHPLPFRLEYSHTCPTCTTPTLTLSYQGNVTASLTPIPSSAYSPAQPGTPHAALAALRTRLYEPAVPWQTYYAPHMGAHVLQPTGLVLSLSIGDQKGAFLGPIRPFPSSRPAAVVPGGHSYNGSDWTALSLSRWAGYNASVSLFSTTAAGVSGEACAGTLGSGAPTRCDLSLLAACTGSDCGQLLLVASLSYAWLGQGSASVQSPTTLQASPAGFEGMSVAALSPAGEAKAGFPPVSLALPFTVSAPLPWAASSDPPALLAALCTGGGNASSPAPAASSLPQALSLLSAARARYYLTGAGAAPGVSPRAAALYEPMRAVLAWNTVFTHFLHVYTPVSRNWADPDAISTFVWDVFFASVMLSTDASDPRAADLAVANTATTLLSRTPSGMVPNYVLGQAGTYDRTEPQLGSWAVRVLRDRLGAGHAWLPELAADVLAGWSDWFAAARRSAVGVLAGKGAGGLADALSLGSNAGNPPGRDTPHTLAAARYESGLDNSPQYDGNDGLCSGPSCPCTFNATSSLMNLYDVAFTAYYALDAAELGSLAAGLNRSDLLPRLAQRRAAAIAALNSDLYFPALGSYSNMLYNGTPVPRWAPTVFAPLLTGAVPAARLPGMLALLADPAVFCVNASHAGTGAAAAPAPPALLLNFPGGPAGIVDVCIRDACVVAAVQARFGVAPELQGNVAAEAGGAATVPLLRYAQAATGRSALVTPAFAALALAAGLQPVGGPAEGYCFAAPPLPGADSTPLVLWGTAGGGAFLTCGTAACNASAAASSAQPLGLLCHAGAALLPTQRACTVALPSISRSDPAFGEQTYWRGRAWAPQAFLTWMGLHRYAQLPEAAAARTELAGMASALFLKQWALFGQVNENLDGLLGLGSDSVRADSFYHWGALGGFLGLLEEGVFPASVLVQPAL